MKELTLFINKNFKILFFVFLILLGLCNFWGSLHNPFIMDDTEHYLNYKKTNPRFFIYDILPNQTFSDKPGMQEYQNNWGYYRPVTHLFYRFEAEAFGDNSLYYHLACIVFFAGANFFIFLFLSFILKNEPAALIGTCLYFLHPFQGLCINFKPAIVFSFQIILLNACFLLAVKNTTNPAKFNTIKYCSSLLLFILALLIHEQAFILPLILFLYWLILDDKKSMRLPYQLAGFILISLAYLLIRLNFESLNTTTFGKIFGYHLSCRDYLASFARVISWIIRRLIYPKGVFLQWATMVDKGVSGKWIWVFGSYLACFSSLLIIFWRNNKTLFFLLLMFLLGLILSVPPSYNLVGSGLIYFEPHWIFYTNIGLFGIIGYLFTIPAINKFIKPLLASVFLFLMYCSFYQNHLYQIPSNYYKAWAQEVPALDLPQLSVCWDYSQQKKYDEAINCFRPLTIEMRINAAYLGMGYNYYLKGDKKNAKKYFQKSLDLGGGVSSLSALSFLDAQEKDPKKAISYLDQALKLDKFSLNLYLAKINLYINANELKKAISILHQAQQIYPHEPQIIISKMSIIFKEKNISEARKLAQEVIRDSNNVNVLLSLTNLLWGNHQDDLAQTAFIKAYELDPQRVKDIQRSFVCPLRKTKK